MKIKKLGVIAGVSLLMLGACDNNGSVNPASTPADQLRQAQADSVATDMGRLIADQYFNVAKRDSAYQTKDASKEFMLGFKQGMVIVTDQETYNDGLMQGIQMAMSMKRFNEHYKVNVNPQVVLNALNEAINGSAMDDRAKAELQVEYHRLMSALESAIREPVKEVEKNIETEAVAKPADEPAAEPAK